MKKFFLIFGLAVLPAFAQTEVKVKSQLPDSNDEDSAIVIRRQRIKDTNELTNAKKYQIVRETVEIEGDDEVTDAGALSSWKAACENWKKEIRELNNSPENRLVNINCGKRQKRQADMGKKVYHSEATFTARVQIRD
jgi:hypothetical protein